MKNILLDIVLFPFNIILSLSQSLLGRNSPALVRPVTGSDLERKMKILEFGRKAAIEEGNGEPLANGTVLKKMIVKVCGPCEPPYCRWTLTTYNTQGTKSCTTFSVGLKFDDWAIIGNSIEWCDGVCYGMLSSSPGAGDGLYFNKDNTKDRNNRYEELNIEAYEFEVVENEVIVRKATGLPESLLESLRALYV